MYKRILVPDDGSATARKALDSAIALANESSGQIRLLHLLAEQNRPFVWHLCPCW